MRYFQPRQGGATFEADGVTVSLGTRIRDIRDYRLVGILLGDTSFVDTFRPLLKDKDQIKEIPRAQRLVDRPSLKALFAHVTHAYTLSEIGRHLGLHYAAMSKIVKRAGGKSDKARPDPMAFR